MVEFTRLDDLKARRPLLHCVSNIVSANDCANVALAVGASPMMAQEPLEMEAVTAISDATVLNTGTPDEAKFAACGLCARAAGAARQPLVLDPVGVGASSWRLNRVEKLLDLCAPGIILRVNLSEAYALLRREMAERGVDATPGPETAQIRLQTAAALAKRRCAVVLLSGPEDIITDGRRAYVVSGGSGKMALVTGTGCMLSVLCGAFAAVESDPLCAAVLASAFWKTCAGRAETNFAGSGGFRVALMDAAGTVAAGELSRTARIKEL